MKKSFDEYCSAGLLVLIIISLLALLLYILPAAFYIAAGLAATGFFIFVPVCYGLGRLVYYIMDRLE
jgi:hypothetical protein